MDHFAFLPVPPCGMPAMTGPLEHPKISSGPDDNDQSGPDLSGIGGAGPGNPEPRGPGGPSGPGPGGTGAPGQEILRAQICIENGSICREKTGARFCDFPAGEIAGVNISSAEPELGGLYVKGKNSNALLRDSCISLAGPGADDFSGVGAAVLCEDGAKLELRNVHIDTAGIIRCCTTATDHSVLRVYDSVLSSVGGNVPANYQPRGPMCHPPQPLGITGDCRTHLTMNNSESYFYDSIIRARSWGALSTDSSMGYVYLEVNRCTVETLEDGYCAYADGGCHDVFRDCQIHSAAMGIIVAGDATATFQNTKVKCRTNLAMIHSVMGTKPVISELDVVGCRVETEGPVILVKSANTAITISGGGLVSKEGILIRSVVNDDKNATKVLPGQTLYGINIRLADGEYTGDILHGDSARTMALVLKDAVLTGAIQNAHLTVGPGGKWFASGDSTVCLVHMDTMDGIDADIGTTIHAVPGESCALRGKYVLPSGGILDVRPM